MAVTSSEQSSVNHTPVYREISASPGAASVDAPGRVLGSVSDIGLCPSCGAERLVSRNENAMPLFVAGAALGVMSIPFMLVTIVGVVALIAAIPMMLAPLMMSSTSTVCPRCQQV